MGGLLIDLRASLHGWLSEAEPYQRLAYGTGALLIASAGFHAVVLVVTGGSLEGPVSWRKPILFGEAFGLTLLCVAWVMTFLPKRRWAGWTLMGAMSLANLYEVAWVSFQQWRGVPSHFNYSTSFDEGLFTVAGAAIAIAAGAIVLVTIWSFFSLRAPPSLAWAIRIGMVLLVLSQIIGFLIIENGNARVFDPVTGAYLPDQLGSAAVFGQAGSMKLPHALSLHALQFLPVLAILLRYTPWHERQRTGVVIGGALGYVAFVFLSLVQAFSGKAPFDLHQPGPLAGVLLAALLTLGALGLTWLGLREQFALRSSNSTLRPG